MSTHKTSQKHTCRTCKNAIPTGSQFGPFCSNRCKMNDLSRWFSESYGIEAVDDDAGEVIHNLNDPHQQEQD